MAKIQELYDRATGEAIYPRTCTEAVYDSQGRDLETRLVSVEKDTDDKLADYTTATQLRDGLAAKQDALTITDDLELTARGVLSVAERAKREAFYDMWDSAFRSRLGYNGAIVVYGSADRERGVLKAYDLELTYAEALEVWKASEGSLHNSQGMAIRRFDGLAVRTLLPINCQWTTVIDSSYAMFANCKNLEVVCFSGVLRSGNMQNIFSGCKSLRRVIGALESSGVLDLRGAFNGCVALEEVEIRYIKSSFSMADCPLLSRASLEKMVSNRIGDISAVITITVHPDVFAKLTGDTSNAAAAALTEAELALWAQALDAAMKKNITFATI